MNHSTTVPFVWQGRADAGEVGPSIRWYPYVRPYTESCCGGGADGMCGGRGGRRNGGRPGAAQGPLAQRAALANVPVMGEPALGDARAVVCVEGPLKAAQVALAVRVAGVLEHGSTPVVLGGGHEVAWGTVQAVTRARADLLSVLAVRFDAHFDWRRAAPPIRERRSVRSRNGAQAMANPSITGFWASAAMPIRRRCLTVPTRWAYGTGWTISCRSRWWHSGHCRRWGKTVRSVMVSTSPWIGMRYPGPSLRGVAPAPLASGKLLAADVAELNPAFKRDGLTARVAARPVVRIARGCAR